MVRFLSRLVLILVILLLNRVCFFQFSLELVWNVF